MPPKTSVRSRSFASRLIWFRPKDVAILAEEDNKRS